MLGVVLRLLQNLALHSLVLPTTPRKGENILEME